MPNRVAPRALLAFAYAYEGDPSAFRRLAAEVADMSPVGLFDKLYKGSLLAVERPADGIAILEEARHERPTVLGLSLLCYARVHLALATGSVKDCEAAVATTEQFKLFGMSNFDAYQQSCWARIAAAAAQDQAGNPFRVSEHLAQARSDADKLGRLGNNSLGVMERFMAYVVFDGLDNKLNQTAELRAARSVSPSNTWLVGDEAYNWFCLGNDREAEAVARGLPGNQLCGPLLVLTALGRPDGRAAALSAYDRFAVSELNWWYRFESAPMLFVLDRPRLQSAAKELGLEAERQPPRDPIAWRPCLSFLTGTLSETELLATVPPNPNDQFYRHYFVGWKRLGDGDREVACQAFEKAYRLKRFHRWQWMLTRAILIRMKDRDWPKALSTTTQGGRKRAR
jgi:hypothetical protein